MLGKKQSGLTVVEVLVVCLVLSIATTGWLAFNKKFQMQKKLELSATQLNDLATSMKKYRIDNERWPANFAALTPRYGSAFLYSAPMGGTLQYSITNDTQTGRASIQMRIPALSNAYAIGLVQKLANARLQTPTGTTVLWDIYNAGSEVAQEGLRTEVFNHFYTVGRQNDDKYLHRDGSRSMMGDLNADGNDIINVGTITAENVATESLSARIITQKDNTRHFLSLGDTSIVHSIFADSHITAPTIGATDNIGAPVVSGQIINARDKLRIPSKSEGGACTSASENLSVGAKGVLTCINGRWTGQPVLRFGSQSRNAIAASVYVTTNSKGGSSTCAVTANGHMVAASWVGGDHEVVGSGGTVVPVGPDGRITWFWGPECRGAYPIVNGFFYYD